LNILSLTGPGGFYLAVAMLVAICRQLRSVRWRRSDMNVGALQGKLESDKRK
jgi:hypothetical protein